MNCVMLHGSAEARELVVNNEFYFQEPYCSKADANALQKANTYKFHVLLTTFEMATKDIRVLAKIQWQVRVVANSVTYILGLISAISLLSVTTGDDSGRSSQVEKSAVKAFPVADADSEGVLRVAYRNPAAE